MGIISFVGNYFSCCNGIGFSKKSNSLKVVCRYFIYCVIYLQRFYKFIMPIAYIWMTISTLISLYILLNSRRFGVLNWVDFPLSRSDDPMMAAAAWCEYEIFVLNILYYIAVNLVLAFLAFMGQYWYAQYLKAKIRRRGPE